MATRPVFEAILHPPFYQVNNIDFEFYSGFSITQKQKSINSLHENYLKRFANKKILEISSKSASALGASLSAFNLEIETKKRKFSVECAFQSSKVFQNGGPYTDLLYKSSIEAKKDTRLRSSGQLIAFKYFNKLFPLVPKDYFYNWLYVNALSINPNASHEILEYDSFTDIEFNPQKSINCQAKAAAIYVGLSKAKMLEQALVSKESFLDIVYNSAFCNRHEQLSFDINDQF